MNNIFKTIKPFMTKHQPEILMSMGIGGMIFSTIWGIKATNRAKDIITNAQDKEYNKAYHDVNKDPYILTNKDKIKLTWKLYIPVVVSMAVSIPCIVAGNRVSNKRNAALAAAYTLSETVLQEYQEKTREIVGEKKYNQIHEGVSQELVNKTHDSSKVIMLGDGESLFFEPLSGRYFKSSWNKISKSANELNASAMGDMVGVTTLNDWFYILGLESTELGDELGWSTVDGSGGIIDISIDSVLTPENQPCGSIRYNTRPKKV